MSKGTTQRDINVAQRENMALSLRIEGYTLDDIAIQCGYENRSGAFKAIRRALNKVPVDNANEMRRIEQMRYEYLTKSYFKRAIEGDLWSVDRVLAISKSLRELMNLDVKPNDIPANAVVVRELPPDYLGGSKDGK